MLAAPRLPHCLFALASVLALAGCRRERLESLPEAAQAAAEAQGKLEVPRPKHSTPPPEDLLVWETGSEDGRTVARQYELPDKSCRVDCLAETTKPLWSIRACVAARREIRLLSNDGEALVVVDPAPHDESGDEDRVVVARIFRRGELQRRVLLSEVSPGTRGLHREGGLVYWLAEAEAGYPVRLAGAFVEVVLAGGRRTMIPLQTAPADAGRAADGAAGSRAPRCADGAPCSYVDADGVYHLVQDASLIPPEYRHRAAPPRGAVDVMPAENQRH